MKLSEGVEWGLHCLIVLAGVPEAKALSAVRLAEFHGVPPAYLAKHLQALSRHGLVETVSGPRGGYRLARRAEEITMLDVVSAIDGPAPAFTCTEIRRRGPAALPDASYRNMCTVHRAMVRAEDAYRAVLREVTVADLAAGVLSDAAPEALLRGAEWLHTAVR